MQQSTQSKEKPIKVSIIIPTRKRSHLLKDRLEVLFNNTPELESEKAELIICYDADDKETEAFLDSNIVKAMKVMCNPLETPANKWNTACKIALGNWLVTISDDCVPQPNWLANALNTKNYGFLGLPDGVTGDRNKQFTPLYMMTKEWARKFHGGVLVIPHYKSWYADVETCARAQASLTFRLAKNSVVRALHPLFGNAENDEIYQIGQSRQKEDLKIFNERKIEGFPDDFESVL